MNDNRASPTGAEEATPAVTTDRIAVEKPSSLPAAFEQELIFIIDRRLAQWEDRISTKVCNMVRNTVSADHPQRCSNYGSSPTSKDGEEPYEESPTASPAERIPRCSSLPANRRAQTPQNSALRMPSGMQHSQRASSPPSSPQVSTRSAANGRSASGGSPPPQGMAQLSDLLWRERTARERTWDTLVLLSRTILHLVHEASSTPEAQRRVDQEDAFEDLANIVKGKAAVTSSPAELLEGGNDIHPIDEAYKMTLPILMRRLSGVLPNSYESGTNSVAQSLVTSASFICAKQDARKVHLDERGETHLIEVTPKASPTTASVALSLVQLVKHQVLRSMPNSTVVGHKEGSIVVEPSTMPRRSVPAYITYQSPSMIRKAERQKTVLSARSNSVSTDDYPGRSSPESNLSNSRRSELPLSLGPPQRNKASSLSSSPHPPESTTPTVVNRLTTIDSVPNDMAALEPIRSQEDVISSSSEYSDMTDLSSFESIRSPLPKRKPAAVPSLGKALPTGLWLSGIATQGDTYN